jgi:hypothetical protein
MVTTIKVRAWGEGAQLSGTHGSLHLCTHKLPEVCNESPQGLVVGAKQAAPLADEALGSGAGLVYVPDDVADHLVDIILVHVCRAYE